MIFSRIKFDREVKAEDIPFQPCTYQLCDGSGLVEVPATWPQGIKMMACVCKKP